MVNKKVFETVEHYLYSYLSLDQEIAEMREEKNTANKRDDNSWIRAKGRVNKAVENQAIHNIKIDEKINKYLRWKAIIEDALKEFKENEPEKEYYIRLRYFKKYNTFQIESEMCLCRSAQIKIRLDIVYYLALFSVKEGLVKI